MDFLEIMSFCGFDMDKAHEMAKESMNNLAEKTKGILAMGSCGVLPELKKCAEDLCVKLATQEVDGKNE